MRTLLIISGFTALALAAMSEPSSDEPNLARMSAAAYRVPHARVALATTALERDMGVQEDDVPAALGALAHCGRDGPMPYGDLVDAVTTLGPDWRRSMRSMEMERGSGSTSDALADVQRLCRTLETTRRGERGAAETVAAVRAVLATDDPRSTVARAMMRAVVVEEIDGVNEIRRDYRERTRRRA